MKNETKAMWNKVYLLYGFVFLLGLGIFLQILYLMFFGKEWRKIAKDVNEGKNIRKVEVRAVRGNIYASNNELLSVSVPKYTIRFDYKVVKQDTFQKYLTPLCDSLHRVFPFESAAAFKRNILEAKRKKNRSYAIMKNVSYGQLMRMKKFPIFNKGRNAGGFIVEEQERRVQPYGKLAARTIGYYNSSSKVGVGLESQYNAYLEGVSETRWEKRVAKGVWRPINEENDVRPENGKDIITTLDVGIQDVAHEALRRCMIENEAEHGCAVLMEVKTGYIKAIVNLTKQDTAYRELYNYAVGESVEPGSTFKLATAIAILEEGKYNLETVVPTGEMDFYGKKLVDTKREGYGDISFLEAFEKSSNVGIAYLAHDLFEERPRKFISYMDKMGLRKMLGVDLKGEGEPYIKNVEDKSWSKLSIPWMSIGYELRLTPLQILSFYNAVANDGKFMKPVFVTAIKNGEDVVERFGPVVLVDKIASSSTIKTVRYMLEQVVENGTAKNLSNSPYKVAGKTGTAQINYANRKEKMTYRASFVGYFPADNPKYSCIVMITNPQKNKKYGGQVAAPVFREIGDKVYATLLRNFPTTNKLDHEEQILPDMIAGIGEEVMEVCHSFGVGIDSVDPSGFVKMKRKDDAYKVEKIIPVKGIMPDVVGMSARDAVYILEKSGIRARISGRGKVSRQSKAAGESCYPNEWVMLDLR